MALQMAMSRPLFATVLSAITIPLIFAAYFDFSIFENHSDQSILYQRNPTEKVCRIADSCSLSKEGNDLFVIAVRDKASTKRIE